MISKGVEENTKKIRQTLKAHLGNRLVDSAQMPHPEEIYTENFMCFCSRSVDLQMRQNGIFFTPVKYTLVCYMPQVSWAVRHTTVCLDIYI